MADPFTSLGIAASIAQFATIALHVGNRVREFSAAQIQLSKNITEVNERLGVLMDCLRRIKEDGEMPQCPHSLDTLQQLKVLILGCTGRAEELQKILDKYYPKKHDTFFSKTKSTIKSFGKDSKINEISRGLAEDIRFLTLHLVISKGNPTTKIKTTPSNATYLMKGSIYDFPGHKAARFLGRSDILSRLSSIMDEPSEAEPRVIVLQGMGGQGKTQIALEYCRRAKRKNKFHFIFWMNASSETALRNSFESVAEKLKSPGQILLDANSRINFVMRILGACHRSWLIIFDNYDDLKAFPSVAEYFPVCNRGNIILTSRAPDTYRMTGSGKFIEVLGMDSGDAVNFLLTATGYEQSKENMEEAMKIVARLGYLPLAIDQAGSYLRDRQSFLTLNSFLDHYEEETKSILSTVPDVWDYLETSTIGQQANAKSVFTTWELSFRLLEPQTEVGMKKAAFIDLLGFFNPQNISEEFFSNYCRKEFRELEPAPWRSLFLDQESNWCSLKFEKFILELKKLSLITSVSKIARLEGHPYIPSDDNDALESSIPSQPRVWERNRGSTSFLRLSLHPLVSDWIRLRLKSNQRRQRFALSSTILANVLTQSFRGEESLLPFSFRANVTCRNEYTSHILAWIIVFKNYYRADGLPMLISLKHPEIECIEICFAFFLHDCGIFPECIELCEWLWSHVDCSTKNRQHIKFFVGRLWTESLSFASRFDILKSRSKNILEYWESVLETSDTMLQKCRHERAIDLYMLACYDEAESQCRKAISHTNGKTVDRFHDQYSIELAASLLCQNQHSLEGLEIIKMALNSATKSKKVKWGSATWTWRDWSIIILYHPEIEMREKLVRELLSVLRDDVGEAHFHVVRTKHQVSEVLLEKGDYIEAEYWARQCIRDSQDTPPRENSDLAFLCTLAEILSAQEDKRKRVEAVLLAHQVKSMLASRDADQYSLSHWSYKLSNIFCDLREHEEEEESWLRRVEFLLKKMNFQTARLIPELLGLAVARFEFLTSEKLLEAKKTVRDIAVNYIGAEEQQDGRLKFDGLEPTLAFDGWYLVEIPAFLAIIEVKIGLYNEALHNFKQCTTLFETITNKTSKFIGELLGLLFCRVRGALIDEDGYVSDKDQQGLKYVVGFITWGTQQAIEYLGAEHEITESLVHDYKLFLSYIEERAE